MNPHAFFDQRKADDDLDQLQRLHAEIQRHNAHARSIGQKPRRRHVDAPGKYAVKQKRDDRLAAGAERKVAAMRKRIGGHHHGDDIEKLRCNLPNVRLRIVNMRDGRRKENQQNAHKQV